jgi:hypothetical protein
LLGGDELITIDRRSVAAVASNGPATTLISGPCGYFFVAAPYADVVAWWRGVTP